MQVYAPPPNLLLNNVWTWHFPRCSGGRNDCPALITLVQNLEHLGMCSLCLRVSQDLSVQAFELSNRGCDSEDKN